MIAQLFDCLSFVLADLLLNLFILSTIIVWRVEFSLIKAIITDSLNEPNHVLLSRQNCSIAV